MTRQTHSRRDLLRFAALGAAATSLSAVNPLRAMCGRSFASISADKLLVIFLPGAMDALYTVAPVGDPNYASVRANLLTPLGGSPIALDNQGFAFLSDHFNILNAAGGPLQNEHMRFVLQVGNPLGQRSHFTEIQIHQTCKLPVGFQLPEDGVMARLSPVAGFDANIPMGTMGNTLQRYFMAPGVDAALIKGLDFYDLAHEDVSYHGQGITVAGSSFPGVSMQGFAGQLRAGMQVHHGQTVTTIPGDPEDLAIPTSATGKFALDSEAALQAVSFMHDGAAFPTDAAQASAAGLSPYPPGYGNMMRAEEAINILESTACSVIGMDIGGWDTHIDQATERAQTDPWLAKLLDSLYRRTVAPGGPLANKPTTILVVSEFGRTNAVNSKLGTDHGVGGIAMVLGPKVRGRLKVSNGVQNWLSIGVPSANPSWNDALEVKSDFRVIYKEYFEKCMMLDPITQLPLVLPDPPLPGLDQTLNIFR